jgi:hypothetical protein
MDKQIAANHSEDTKRRSQKRLRKLFLASGLMAAAMVAGPAVARPDPGPKPPPKKVGCVRGERQTRYVSADRKWAPDHSYVRITWEPRFCASSDEWITSNAPNVSLMGPGTANGLSLELDAPHNITNGVEYRGRVRQCLPLSVSKGPVGTSGAGCYTVGNVTFNATVAGDKVSYSWKMSTTNTSRISDPLIRKFKWTDKVV